MLKILHISDIHYKNKYSNPDNSYEEILYKMRNPILNLKDCLKTVNLNEIDLIIISGDLCDSGSIEDYQTLKKIIDKLFKDKIVLFTLGNHDIKENFKVGWLKREADNMPLNYSYHFKGYDIISLDNSVYDNPDGYLSEKSFKWLKKELKKNSNPKILFMHHHLHYHPGVKPLADKELLEPLINDSGIIMILCGHSHSAYLGTFGKKEYYVANSMAFKGENHFDKSVTFKEKYGYNYYEVEGTKVVKAKIEVFFTGKLISMWQL